MVAEAMMLTAMPALRTPMAEPMLTIWTWVPT